VRLTIFSRASFHDVGCVGGRRTERQSCGRQTSRASCDLRVLSRLVGAKFWRTAAWKIDESFHPATILTHSILKDDGRHCVLHVVDFLRFLNQTDLVHRDMVYQKGGTLGLSVPPCPGIGGDRFEFRRAPLDMCILFTIGTIYRIIAGASTGWSPALIVLTKRHKQT